jgi:hypothetical protein
MDIVTARRSRMKHDESEDVTLGPEWICLMSLLKKGNAELRHWPLTLIYLKRDEADDPMDFGFVVAQELRDAMMNAVLTAFPKGRRFGLQPCGLELFGKNTKKGYDPGMNAHEKAVIKDFFRNTDNWVSALIS